MINPQSKPADRILYSVSEFVARNGVSGAYKLMASGALKLMVGAIGKSRTVRNRNGWASLQAA